MIDTADIVSDADREKAREAIKASSPEVYVDEYVIDGELPPLIEAIARALAEERAEAREPFLRAVDVIERPLLSERESGRISERTQAFQDAAAIIRLTAKETK